MKIRVFFSPLHMLSESMGVFVFLRERALFCFRKVLERKNESSV